MAEYSYIHIALRGNEGGTTRTLYSYPSTPTADGVNPDWDTMMVEPGAAIKRFLNASECYVLQEAPEGHYISLITRSASQPEKGWMMISILVDNGCSLTGREVNSLFAGLKTCLIEEPDLTDEAVDVALIKAQAPRLPVKLESWRYTAPEGTEPEAEAGYRTYISVQDLEAIFSFPSQPEYARFRCVLVVSATTSLRPGVKMPRITVPIRKQYTVECPEGVKASKSLVYDGDRLTLTYEKEGYGAHEETVTVGQPAAYTKYEGPKIMVRTAAQTGIRFVRRIAVKVVSAKGAPLTGYTIQVNDRNISTMVPYIDFTERDLKPDSEVELEVRSNNYRTLKMTKPVEEMLHTDSLTFELQPVEQEVTLRLDFGDGRVFEQQISIEKNTPEYNRLHSGNFHGFRAHRQVTDDNTEVYNVDVRLTNPPMAPNFETGRGEDEGRPHSPKFVNISDETAEERPEIDTTLPTKDEEPINRPERDNDGDDYDDDFDGEQRKSFFASKTFKWLLAGAVAIAAVVAAVFLIPESGTPVESGDQAEASIAEETPGAAATIAVTPEEQADIDYLNGNAAWNLDSLRSPMGIALAEAIRTGNLDAVARNDYFAVEGRCTNARAGEIAEMAWRAIGSPNQSGNARRLRDAGKKKDIVLKELSDAMAKVRPSENINESPRPRK